MFFVDQCLGRGVAESLRELGVETHYADDCFPQGATDVDWLPEVGAKGWILLTRDKRIRHRVLERNALMAAGLRVFVLANRRVNAQIMRETLTTQLPNILAMATNQPPPFIAGISKQGVKVYDLG